MIRVLVADDSPTARALVVSILNSDQEIRVIGEATNGLEAVEMTTRLRPDLVTMDVHMPHLDGFQATKEIMIQAPTPILIVSASIAPGDIEVSMHSLRVGALAVLAKPPGPESPRFDDAARELIANVKALSQVKVVRHWRPMQAGAGKSPARPPSRVRLVAIAASTGGPAALQRILSSLPGDFPVPILVVQHITNGFTPGLADWLNKECNFHVKIATHGEPLAPHTVYLAPDDRHLGVQGHHLVVAATPPIGGFRPSASHLFQSVAQAFGPATLAVILTGMGDDGVAGLRQVREAGGRILAQDEKTSIIFGMPGAAIAAGLADQVLPLDVIPPRLVELVNGT